MRFDRVGSRLAIATVAAVALACGQSPRGGVTVKPEGNAATVVGSSGSESSVVTSVTGQSMTMSQEDPRGALPRPSAPCGQGTRAQWTPPLSLNRELGHAAGVLVELGLTDPRGLRLVNARVFAGRFAGNDAPTPAMGWLVPARDDAPAMLLSLRGDLVALDGEASPLTQIDSRRLAPASGWTAMRRARASGTIQHNYLSAVLLALSGDVRSANTLWNSLEVHGGSKSRAAMLEFAELYFDSALAGFRAGRYAPARVMARALECARPYIEEHGSSLTATTSFEGGQPRMTQERSTEFLAALPALAEELRRRATATRTALDPSQFATASVASLINELDTVELRWAEYGNPYEREPLLRALRARGATIVPELIDAFERDARWTRTIEHESYPLHRYVDTVRGLLAWLINETTGIYASEFGWRSFSDPRDASSQEVAVALRNRWRAVGELTPFARAISTLEDTSANFSRQIFGVAWLFRPADGQPSAGALVRGVGPRVIDRFAIEGPALTSAQREQLVRALRLRAPGIGPLRDRSQVVLEEEDRRCAYSQMMFLASPTDAAPFVRETLERTYARNPDQLSPGCAAWLAGALVATGDRGAADEVARRIRSLRAGDTELRSAAGWWYALANRAEAQPIWDAIARDVGDVREWPVQTAADRRENFVAPGTLSVVSKPLLRVRVLREVLLRLLDDARTNAIIQVQGDSNEAQYLNPRGVRALTFERSAEGADFIARGTTERLRLADGVADFLAREGALEPAIEFDLRWTRARRDVAISAMKDQLRAMP